MNAIQPFSLQIWLTGRVACLYTFFNKQSIFDSSPENCLSFSEKSPQKLFSNCLVDGHSKRRHSLLQGHLEYVMHFRLLFAPANCLEIVQQIRDFRSDCLNF